MTASSLRPATGAGVACALVMSALGVCEWLAVAGGGRGDPAPDVRSLLAIVAGLGLAGGALGAIAPRVASRGASSVTGTSLAVGGFALLVGLESRGLPGLVLLGAVAWAAWRVIGAVAARAPGLFDLRVLASAHGLLVAVAIGIVAWRAGDVDGSGRLAAATAIAAAVPFASVLSTRIQLGALLAALGVAAAVAFPSHRIAADRSPPEAAPSILLVTIDTLRADRVGVYGYDAARTPNLDALAGEGRWFSETTTHSPWTLPSHTSILTGRLPTSHGVLVNDSRLDPTLSSLPDRLRAEGYLTAGFVSAWVLDGRASGLARHFDVYDDDPRDVTLFPYYAYRTTLVGALGRLFEWRGLSLGRPDRPAGRVTDAATRWLGRGPQHPFFLWVHYYDPHLPYEPPAELVGGGDARVSGRWYALDGEERAAIVKSPDAMRQMNELYDAEVANVDRELGRLLAAARAAAGDELIVAVTADHGESFGEHESYYGRDAYEATARVPLVLAGARVSSRAPTAATARLVDVAPTLLDLAGFEPQGAVDGTSLFAAPSGGDRAASAMIIVPADADSFPASQSIRDGGWKLIHRDPGWLGSLDQWRPESFELYDLGSDPAEQRNLASRGLAREAELARLLGPFTHGSEGPDRRALDPEERERLRALGYLGD